jgi:hypothetical protein
MDWKNVNLKSSYERAQNIIYPLDFDTLLLEVNCNLREINRVTVMQQFETDLQNRIQSAREAMKDNIDNIVKEAIEHRDS